MRLKEAMSGFEGYLNTKGYALTSRKNHLRYCRNRLTRDLFVLLPFKNIFGYTGTLSFLTMGDYLKHYPEDFAWEKYVLKLPLEALEQRTTRTLWETAPAGSGARLFLRYLQEEGLLGYPVIVRRKPKWRQEVDSLIKRCAPPRPETLDEGLGLYLRYLIDYQNITEQGLHGQYAQLKAALCWFEQPRGVKNLKQIDYELVRAFLDYRQHERGNSQTTLHHAAAALKEMFGFLAREGYLEKNPLEGLVVKRTHTVTAENVPTPAEMETLLNYTQQEVERYRNINSLHRKELLLALRNRAILFILCTTGLRASELMELTVAQLDTFSGCIRIQGKGNSRYAKKERMVFLEDADTVDALAKYLKIRPKGYGGSLFLSKNGLAMAPQDLRKMVEIYSRRAGLNRPYSPHKLRAGFASLMVSQGIDPLTLKELMGHDALNITLRYYTNLEEEQIRQVWKECNPLSQLRRKEEEKDD